MIDFTSKKFFLLDLDGTLYAGSHIFPQTMPFLDAVRESGRKPIFLTNNSSRSVKEYLEKLGRLGFAKSEDEIYTSGTATMEYLRKKGMQKIFLVATPAMEEEFRASGFELADGKNELPQAVVLTFDTTFTYDKFCVAHDLITAGVQFIATHPDIHVPLENGIMHPDIGTLISAIHTSTGKRPLVIGKPKKYIYDLLREKLACEKGEMVMVGDRLYTDIRGANDYGMDSVLVLSGETTMEMVEDAAAKTGLDMRPGTGMIPSLAVKDVGELIPYINGTL